jgi:signal transduction histidine kinase
MRELVLLDDLRQAERRAVSSRVASVIAHLIGTPLHVIAGRASLIRSVASDPTVAENARRIEEQVDRLAKRIRALIEYLTAPEPEPKAESASVVVATALALYAPIALERGVVLRAVDGPAVDVRVDGTSVLVVLTSLLSLATRIGAPGEVAELATTLAEDGQVAFALDVPSLETPTGRIDSLEPPKEPSRAGSEALQVLSVCSAIARRAGSTLSATARAGGGTTIQYRLARME